MKKKIVISLLTLLFLLSALSSCVSKKHLSYLQYSDESRGEESTIRSVRAYVSPPDYRVLPYDNLYIRVITPDPQWSNLFNADLGMGGLSQESASLVGYTVDADGFIEIPYVGRIEVAGMKLPEIKARLDSIFTDYVTDAAITVRLVNNFISIIGEVNSPGRYPLSKDQITIFEAISLAGDLSYYGNRQKAQIIRPSPYGPIIKEVTLLDRSILTSEYYYVLPNDIIYIMPRRGRTFQINSSTWSLFLTTLTSTLGIIAFFRTL